MNRLTLSVVAVVMTLLTYIADARRPVEYDESRVTKAISLSARATRSGNTLSIELTWSDAPGATIDLYRNGVKIANTANDGHYRELQTLSGPGRLTYKVCRTDTSACSNVVGLKY